MGGRIARRLTERGRAQRLVVRDPGRAPRIPSAPVVQAEYGDREAAERALAGVDTLLMVSGAETTDRVDRHRVFIEAARAAGVRHVVYISFFGAAPDATFTLARDHWATEEHLRASGLDWTVLRDNLYLDFLPMMIGGDGVIRGPAGDGRFAAVAQDDIADAATAVLLDPERCAGAVYQLTGPQNLTLGEAAAIMAAGTGRSVRYQQETLEQAYASRAGYGAPRWQVDAWVSTYTAIANGELEGVTDDVPELAGHPATSLAELLERTQGGLP